jgi:hypothetical protein
VNKSAKVVLGRVLINAQIAAGYALTLRLRCGDLFLRLRLRLPKKLNSPLIVSQAHTFMPGERLRS